MSLFKIILIFAAAIMLGVIIWGTNKGFDLTDEAFYMMGYNQQQVVDYQSTYFWLPVRSAFNFLELNILNIRILRLILTIFSSLVFSYGFFIWLKSIKDYKADPVLIFSIILIGNLASYSVLPQSLSYNSLNAIYQNISTGLLLLALPQKNKYLIFIFILLACFIIPFQLITKITSGLLNIFCIFIVLTFYNFKLDRYKKIFAFLGIVSGIMLGYMIYFVFIQNIHDYFNGIIEFSTQTNVDYGHSYEYQIFRFLKPFRDIILQIAPFYLFWLFMLYVYNKKLLNFDKKVRSLIKILLTGLFVSSFFYVFYFIQAKRTTFVYFGIIAFVMILIIRSIYIEKIRIKEVKNELIIMLFLVIIPFSIAYGSTDNVWYNSYFSLSMWFMVILWAFYFSRDKNIVKISLSASLILCFIIFIQGYIFLPFRMKPLVEQNIPVENNKIFEGIKVDDDIYQLIKNINETVKITNFHKGDPVIALGTYPGLICLIEGVQYCDVIYYTGDYFSKKSIDKNSKYLKKPILFVSDQYDLNLSGNYLNALKDNGLGFPEKYIKIGSVMYRKEKLNIYDFNNR